MENTWSTGSNAVQTGQSLENPPVISKDGLLGLMILVLFDTITILGILIYLHMQKGNI